VDAPGAAGGEDYCFGPDSEKPAGGGLDGCHARAAAVLDEQRGDERLIVADELRVAERGLKERVEQVEAGLVGGEAGAPGGHAAEGAGADAAIGVAAPGTAPALELDELARCLAHEKLDGILIG